ncbi:hypothetical protein ACIA8G_08610 [Lentzea sp. NPDC051213]|uniref:hypothetical protein n=1 Tax=Lentzea sp. NPDC051213 TaxID=3364126 RepID=UPI003792D203
MAKYEVSVPVYFRRINLGNHPMPLEDTPFDQHDYESLAVSAGDAIGLNSVTSNHTAHVTLEVFVSSAEVPADIREQEPHHWFISSARKIALTDLEGMPALVLPAPPPGRVLCAVTCSGRDEAFAARHFEHRDDVRGIERWHVTLWPEA